jgi:hypothetical protein
VIENERGEMVSRETRGEGWGVGWGVGEGVGVVGAGVVMVWVVVACGPPLLLTVWPVKTCASEVPAVLVTVSRTV